MGVFVNDKGSIKKSAIWLTALAGVIVILVSAYVAYMVASGGGSRTAYGTMGFRAVAAQDPDPKTRNPDYLAAKFCQQIGVLKSMGLSDDFEQSLKAINKRNWLIFYYINARTKHMDQVLLNELMAGVKQVVIMGAGFDSRAYRFHKDFPRVRFIEVDLPATSASKKELVADSLSKVPSTVAYAPIDFNTQELGQVLASVDYKKDQKTLFLWEGVTMYLDASAVEGTLQFIARNSAPGSSVVFDYLPPSVVAGTYTKEPYAKALAANVRKKGEPFTFGIDHDKSEGFLMKQGLVQVSNLGHADLVKRYMTSSDGKPFGNVPGFFWITQAKVPGR